MFQGVLKPSGGFWGPSGGFLGAFRGFPGVSGTFRGFLVAFWGQVSTAGGVGVRTGDPRVQAAELAATRATGGRGAGGRPGGYRQLSCEWSRLPVATAVGGQGTGGGGGCRCSGLLVATAGGGRAVRGLSCRQPGLQVAEVQVARGEAAEATGGLAVGSQGYRRPRRRWPGLQAATL